MSREEKVIGFESQEIMQKSSKKKKIMKEDPKVLVCSKKRKIIISSIIASVILLIILLFILYVYPCIECKGGGDEIPIETDKVEETTSKTIVIDDLGPIEEEFKITTNVNDLTRIYVNQKSYENIKVNGQITQTLIDRKTTYDIYIISSKESDEEVKNLYNETYLCAITISSECISTDDEYCIPQKLVDFIDQDYSHVRNLDEVKDLEIPRFSPEAHPLIEKASNKFVPLTEETIQSIEKN